MSTAWHICKGETNFVGKNQDVIYDGVYMYTNQRGLAKTAFILPPDQPASWVSIYGNLTVSQIGKECPNGGMNEEGLVVEQTTLWQAAYPAPDERPAVSELQWIQYMLDTCATVGEVLEAASRVRIAQNQSHLHYMVCDKRGDRAIIEFLNGEMAVYKDASLPCPVMANSLYQETIRTRHERPSRRKRPGITKPTPCTGSVRQTNGLPISLSFRRSASRTHSKGCGRCADRIRCLVSCTI